MRKSLNKQVVRESEVESVTLSLLSPERMFCDGLMTKEERINKSVDIWY